MKEIRFRVPIKCNSCKFVGFQYWEWNGQQFIEDGYDECECKKNAFEIMGDAQQYIGINDNTTWKELAKKEKEMWEEMSGYDYGKWRGKLIYETDIIELNCGCCRYTIEYYPKKAMFWPLDNGASQIHDKDVNVWKSKCKIIGNQVQNPKLMKLYGFKK